jgi:hypothetical protein
MKNLTRYSWITLLAFGAFACEKQAPSVNDADLFAAAKMIGETLSDQRDGLVSTLFDATAVPVNGTMQLGGFFAKELAEDELATPGGLGMTPGMGGMHGRGSERGVTITYDSLTGVHTITFQRSVSRGDFSKSVSFVHKIIYRNAAGAFLRFPRRQQVASVEFEGTRTGSVNGPLGASNFKRDGAFTQSGLEAASTKIDFNGTFSGEGSHTFTNVDSVQETRAMVFNYKLRNISIEKSALKLEQPLSEGVTGAIDYKVKITKTINGASEVQELEGTIELNGDGTALLEYLGRGSKFILDLNTGSSRRRR